MMRNKYPRFVLDQFGAVVYAYAGIDVRGDKGRVMDLAERGVCLGSDPGEHPGSWFLAGAVSFSEAENTRFSALWEKAKPDVIFKDRGEEE